MHRSKGGDQMNITMQIMTQKSRLSDSQIEQIKRIIDQEHDKRQAAKIASDLAK